MTPTRASVALIHGLGRTSRSLAPLARHLRQHGHEVHRLGYSAMTEPFEQIVLRMRAEIEPLARSPFPLALIGHSLGGILARAALALDPPLVPPARHLIMLGPPNQPPRLAGRLRRNWVYRWINGDAGQRLADPAFLASLPPLTIPHTIIAGTAGPIGRWSPFGTDPNDGIVAVNETRAVPDETVIELPVRHTFMMNDRHVRTEIIRVLAAIKQTVAYAGDCVATGAGRPRHNRGSKPIA